MSLREDAITQVMSAVSRDFETAPWVDEAGRVLGSVEDISKSISERCPDDYEKHGLTWAAKTAKETPIVLIVATGGDEFALNSFKIKFSSFRKLPSVDLFLRLLPLVLPFEAFFYLPYSERILRGRERNCGTKQYPVRSLRCVHFLGFPVVRKLGRVEEISTVVGGKVTQLADGLVLQFAESIDCNLDEDDSLRKQLAAMECLGMVVEA